MGDQRLIAVAPNRYHVKTSGRIHTNPGDIRRWRRDRHSIGQQIGDYLQVIAFSIGLRKLGRVGQDEGALIEGRGQNLHIWQNRARNNDTWPSKQAHNPLVRQGDDRDWYGFIGGQSRQRIAFIHANRRLRQIQRAGARPKTEGGNFLIERDSGPYTLTIWIE